MKIVKKNHEKIRMAIEEANSRLTKLTKRRLNRPFGISRDKYYQLSNRFAWCWKMASLGIPVLLVYLGLLNASEMGSGDGTIFKTHEDWDNLFKEKPVQEIVPYEAWGEEINVNGTPFTPILKTYHI